MNEWKLLLPLKLASAMTALFGIAGGIVCISVPQHALTLSEGFGILAAMFVVGFGFAIMLENSEKF